MFDTTKFQIGKKSVYDRKQVKKELVYKIWKCTPIQDLLQNPNQNNIFCIYSEFQIVFCNKPIMEFFVLLFFILIQFGSKSDFSWNIAVSGYQPTLVRCWLYFRFQIFHSVGAKRNFKSPELTILPNNNQETESPTFPLPLFPNGK